MVKRLFSLRKKSERAQQQRFLVEGERAISGFMDHGWTAHSLLLRKDREAPKTWRSEETFSASNAVLQKLTNHKNEPGYLAEFSMPEQSSLDPQLGGLVLYKISDPGNAGTLIRSAAAFGWQQVLLVAGVDPYAPKVVQASVGAIAGIQIHAVSEVDGVSALQNGADLAALVVDGGQDPKQMPAKARWLVIGSEAHGLPDDILGQCQEQISIPMASQVESLNAAVAGSIVACTLGKH